MGQVDRSVSTGLGWLLKGLSSLLALDHTVVSLLLRLTLTGSETTSHKSPRRQLCQLGLGLGLAVRVRVGFRVRVRGQGGG